MKHLKNLVKIAKEWLENKTVLEYGANTMWLAAARFSWIITAFTVGLLVARKLGPEQFGVLNYSIAWIGMFAVILDMGVGGIIQREIVKNPEQEERLLGNFAMFKAIQTLIMLLLAAGVLFFSNHTPEVLKLILILMAGYCTNFATALVPYFAAVVKNKYEAGAQIISCVIYNLIRLCAVFFDWSLTVYAIAESVMSLTYHLSMLGFYQRCGSSIRNWSFRFKEVFSLLIPAIPLSFSGIFSTIYSKTDIIMLEYFQGFESVGFYTLASRFTLNLALFSGLLSSVFSTAVASSCKISDSEYRKQLHRFYFMLFWIMIPFFPFFLLAAPYIFEILYGETYLPAATIFGVYICTLPFTGMFHAFYWHCMMGNKLKTIAAANGAGALINVVLNWFMIPRLGVTGAAWSSVISMPAGLILLLLCTADGRKMLWFILKALFTLPSFRLNHSGT